MVVSVTGMEREPEASETLVRVTFTDGGVLLRLKFVIGNFELLGSDERTF